MTNENEYERAMIFYKRKTLVHVSTDKNTFYNGRIIEVSKSFFVIKDRFNGTKFIFFSELKKPLEPYTNDKEEEEKNGEI